MVIGAGALIGSIALTVATGGAVALGIVKIVGSVALSTASSATIGYITNGKQGAIDGACNGFMWGSIGSLIGSYNKYKLVDKALNGSSPNVKGVAGEKLAKINQNAKRSFWINNRKRVPDAIRGKRLVEVKCENIS